MLKVPSPIIRHIYFNIVLIFSKSCSRCKKYVSFFEIYEIILIELLTNRMMQYGERNESITKRDHLKNLLHFYGKFYS